MKQQPSLPSLNSSGRKHSETTNNNVKQIESKISQHET